MSSIVDVVGIPYEGPINLRVVSPLTGVSISADKLSGVLQVIQSFCNNKQTICDAGCHVAHARRSGLSCCWVSLWDCFFSDMEHPATMAAQSSLLICLGE